jgi:N-formylglutamate amidohydrolase
MSWGLSLRTSHLTEILYSCFSVRTVQTYINTGQFPEINIRDSKHVLVIKVCQPGAQLMHEHTTEFDLPTVTVFMKKETKAAVVS